MGDDEGKLIISLIDNLQSTLLNILVPLSHKPYQLTEIDITTLITKIINFMVVNVFYFVIFQGVLQYTIFNSI